MRPFGARAILAAMDSKSFVHLFVVELQVRGIVCESAELIHSESVEHSHTTGYV